MNTVLFLLSDKSAMTSGQHIMIDGGMTACWVIIHKKNQCFTGQKTCDPGPLGTLKWLADYAWLSKSEPVIGEWIKKDMTYWWQYLWYVWSFIFQNNDCWSVEWYKMCKTMLIWHKIMLFHTYDYYWWSKIFAFSLSNHRTEIYITQFTQGTSCFILNYIQT